MPDAKTNNFVSLPSRESIYDRSFDRRKFFARSSVNLSSMALATLLGKNTVAAAPFTLPVGRAKHIIYLHMVGAPSQLDLFEQKPELTKRNKQPCPEELTKGRDFAFIGKTSVLASSPWRFNQHGQSGHTFSELLPNLSMMADELTFIRTIRTEEINHAPAQMFLHSGFGRGGRPSLGAWVTYGLGSENSDLPSYVVLVSGPTGGAGTSLWSNGFLPSVYQGTPFRSQGDPVLFLTNPVGQTNSQRQKSIETIAELNREHAAYTGDPEIETRIAQYELAFQMQTSVPDLMNIGQETAATLEMYGAAPGKASFANNCLLARRLIERGVRMVELYDADWDHHNGITNNLPRKCQETDRPMAALLNDLRRRGLLEDTLIIWGSEFGRTPLQQGDDRNPTTLSGRDHHKDAFTVWLAGGGIKPGLSYGRTDDFGMDAIENPVHVHDLNATILHLLGIDHTQLTYRFQGRDFRLTDVHGNVIHSITQGT